MLSFQLILACSHDFLFSAGGLCGVAGRRRPLCETRALLAHLTSLTSRKQSAPPHCPDHTTMAAAPLSKHRRYLIVSQRAAVEILCCTPPPCCSFSTKMAVVDTWYRQGKGFIVANHHILLPTTGSRPRTLTTEPNSLCQ